jgi:hypothetical protein
MIMGLVTPPVTPSVTPLGLDHGVGAGEDEGLVPVGVPHEIGRLTVGAAHLHDLAEMVLLAHGAPVHVQLVTDCCVHRVGLRNYFAVHPDWPGCPRQGRGYRPVGMRPFAWGRNMGGSRVDYRRHLTTLTPERATHYDDAKDNRGL